MSDPIPTPAPSPPIPAPVPRSLWNLAMPVVIALFGIGCFVAGSLFHPGVLPTPVPPLPVPVVVEPTASNPVVIVPPSTDGTVPKGDSTAIGVKLFSGAKFAWLLPPSKCFTVHEGAANNLIVTPTMDAQYTFGVASVVNGAIWQTWYTVKSGKGPQPPPDPVVPDAFQATIQAAFVADGKPAAQAAQLASLYKMSGPTVSNPAFTKSADVLNAMHSAATTLIGDKLPSVRRVLADDFNKVIGGKSDTVLDAPTRAIIQAEFLKAQQSLEVVK